MTTDTKEETRLAPTGNLPLLAANFTDLHRQARALAPSALIPKGLRGGSVEETLANVTMVLAYGREVGLGPVASLSGIAIVNGRPFAESQTLAALVRASGHCRYLRKEKSGRDSVTWTTWRNGEPQPDARTFSMTDAQAAGLAGRDTYKQHPERMLSARALGWLLRDVYPDVVKGLGTEVEREEAQEREAPRPVAVVVEPLPPTRTEGLKRQVKELNARAATAPLETLEAHETVMAPGVSDEPTDEQIAASRAKMAQKERTT